jgi:hypothetical protein
LPVIEIFRANLFNYFSTTFAGIVCSNLPNYGKTVDAKTLKVTFFVSLVYFFPFKLVAKSRYSASLVSTLILAFVFLRLNFAGMAIAFIQANGSHSHLGQIKRQLSDSN